jgi:hypothetical protein
MSLSKVIETARADLGYTENPPGSNRVKYWDAYDPKMQGQPWCVSCQWDWFNRAGERMAFFGGGKTASCSVLLRWYGEQGLTVPVSEVQKGDIVLLNFNGKGTPDHCGLVEFVLPGGWAVGIRTIEGNTSPSDGSQSNGGMVCEKTRYPSQIVAVCRPQYSPDPQPVDDITERWSEADIRWCIKNGLMEGYPDGSWKPKQAVTREELAVILRRFHRFMEDDGK